MLPFTIESNCFRKFIGVGFAGFLVSCGSSHAAPPCPTIGEPVPPGGYGCDVTFANDADANMCLAPIHVRGSPFLSGDATRGEQLEVDGYEGGKGANRSVYINIAAAGKLSTGLVAPLVVQDRPPFPMPNLPVGSLLVQGDVNVDGLVEFAAYSGSASLTQVLDEPTREDVTIKIDGATMGPYAPDPMNQEGRGMFSASVFCRVQAQR
jgi:hypothetical protein